MDEQKLKQIQERIARQVGHKVDVYHSEKYRVVAVFYHNSPPTPKSLIYLYHY